MPVIRVFHEFYGCDTGCCGHVVEMGDQTEFKFDHPYDENAFEWAKRLVAEVCGEEHVADLDFANSDIVDD